MNSPTPKTIYEKVWNSPIGRIWLYADTENLLALCFEDNVAKIRKRLGLEVWSNDESPILRESVKQLDEYFSSKRRSFDLPVALMGSDFQRDAWKALQAIPFGEARTYSEQADAIGRSKAVRAIGAANSQNAISIVIPCHRVIGKSGRLVGYAGGEEVKRRLLELEGFKF